MSNNTMRYENMSNPESHSIDTGENTLTGKTKKGRKYIQDEEMSFLWVISDGDIFKASFIAPM